MQVNVQVLDKVYDVADWILPAFGTFFHHEIHNAGNSLWVLHDPLHFLFEKRGAELRYSELSFLITV